MNIDIWKRVLVGIYVEEDNMNIIEDLPFTNISEPEIATIKALAHQIKVLMTKVYNTIKNIAIEYHSIYIVSEKTTIMSWYYDPEHPVANEIIFKVPNEWRTLSTESAMKALLSETDPQRIIDICVKPLENIRNRLQYICGAITKYSDDDDSKEELIQKCIYDINDIISEIPTYPNVPERLDTNDIVRLLGTVYASAAYKDKVRMWKQISEWLNLDVKQPIEHKDENSHQPIVPQVEGCGPASAPGMNEKLTKEYFEDKKAEKAKRKQLKKLVDDRPPRVKIPISEDEAKTFIKYDNSDYVAFWNLVDILMDKFYKVFFWTNIALLNAENPKADNHIPQFMASLKSWAATLCSVFRELSSHVSVPYEILTHGYLNKDANSGDITMMLPGEYRDNIESFIGASDKYEIRQVYLNASFYFPTMKEIATILTDISARSFFILSTHGTGEVGRLNEVLREIKALFPEGASFEILSEDGKRIRTIDTEISLICYREQDKLALELATLYALAKEVGAKTNLKYISDIAGTFYSWFTMITEGEDHLAIRLLLDKGYENSKPIIDEMMSDPDHYDHYLSDKIYKFSEDLDKYLALCPRNSKAYQTASKISGMVAVVMKRKPATEEADKNFWETADDIMIHLARIYRWVDEVITAVDHWPGLQRYVVYKKSCEGTRAIRGTIKEWYKPLVTSLKEISAVKPVPSGVEAKYFSTDPDKIDSLLDGDEQLIISSILDKNSDDIIDVYNNIVFYSPTIKYVCQKLEFISSNVDPEHRKVMLCLMHAFVGIMPSLPSTVETAEKVSDEGACGMAVVRSVDTEAKVLACTTIRECILHVAVINETIRRLDNCGIKHNFSTLFKLSDKWFMQLTKLDPNYAKPAMNRASEIVEIAKDGKVPLDEVESNVIDRFKALCSGLDKYMDFVPNTSEEYKIAYSIFNEAITYARIHGIKFDSIGD
ncbi:MAG: hypothetical protein J6Y02_24125 [Pseudobutyrivibrio sp.]|nr:hypothetical protein [Pseudobutyrivibrio sp.]